MATDVCSLPWRTIPDVAECVALPRVPVDVDVNEYERSHMKAPRGRGCWLFLFPSHAGEGPFVGSANGTFGEAKRRAVRYAKHRGAAIISVLP